MSIKSTIAAIAASPFVFAGAAFAGPYVNVEANSGWTGTDYTGTNTDLHVGYDVSLGESADFYVQGGATVTAPDGTDGDTVPSGKLGLSASLTEAFGAYGEVSFVGSGSENVDRGYGAKAGVKYSF